MEEVGAVIDAGLFGGRAAEDFGFPGVAGGVSLGMWRKGRGKLQMGVEVDDADGAVFAGGC